jgi:hypothetical protein
LPFLKSAPKEDSFDTHHGHIQWEKILGLLGIDLKFEVVFGIIWGPLSYIDDFLYERQNLMIFFTKHAKQAVLFKRNKRNCLFRFKAKFRETPSLFRETRKLFRFVFREIRNETSFAGNLTIDAI